MNLSTALINKFLEGRCTAEEAEVVLNALREHPQLLDEYIGKEQWDEIDEGEAVMPQDAQQRITEQVLKQTIKKKAVTFLMVRRSWMAAACILLALGAGWFYYQQKRSAYPSVTAANTKGIIVNVLKTTDTTVRNNGNQQLILKLSEGSEIQLGLNSTVRYQPKFDGQKREIYLQGEAYFKVAKNRLKPFVVYSHGISTTALGTSFMVKALDNEKLVYVNLYTGKVVIKQASANAGLKKDIYLLPGDKLAINTSTFKSEINSPKPIRSSKENIQGPSTPVEKPKSITFDREPLAGVFDQLAKQYNTKIIYSKSTLNGLSFTGRIQTSADLGKILENIAFINDLKITKTPKGYQISTSH